MTTQPTDDLNTDEIKIDQLPTHQDFESTTPESLAEVTTATEDSPGLKSD